MVLGIVPTTIYQNCTHLNLDCCTWLSLRNTVYSVTNVFTYVHNKSYYNVVHCVCDWCRLTYAVAGVDISAGDDLVERIKPVAKATRRHGCNPDLGLFGGVFDLKSCGYADAVLVTGCDGVGTKLQVVFASSQRLGGSWLQRKYLCQI